MNLQTKHEKGKFISYVYSKNAYVNMYYNPRIPDPRPFLIGTCESAVCIRIESGVKIRIRIESRIKSAVGPTIGISIRSSRDGWQYVACDLEL